GPQIATRRTLSTAPPWRVAWTPAAVDDLASLDEHVTSRIRRAVQYYARDRQGDVKKLQGVGNRWRLRVGDWRVLFRFLSETQTLVVLRVLNRRDAYPV